MAEASTEQDQYIIDQLAAINPALVFVNAATYGPKFGIYYNDPSGIETANFHSIGPDRNWQTDWNAFVDLVTPILDHIKSVYGA